MIDGEYFAHFMHQLIEQQTKIANALEIIALVELDENNHTNKNRSEYGRIANIKAQKIIKD